MNKNQHVTPHKDGGWQVKGEGYSKNRNSDRNYTKS